LAIDEQPEQKSAPAQQEFDLHEFVSLLGQLGFQGAPRPLDNVDL
jgi:hypothetical protein